MTQHSFFPWHPWFGCSPISPSCGDCHVITQRFSHPGELEGLVDMTAGGPVFNGKHRFNEDQIDFPYSLKMPSEVSVLPHGDIFHPNAPDAWVDRVFDVMEGDPRHVYQVLTKRSERMVEYLRSRYAGSTAPAHIAVGVSIEGQKEADRRISDLLNAPADFKWLTIFALRGPIDIYGIPNLDFVQLMMVRRVLLAGSLKDPHENPDWYSDLRRNFELLGVPVTVHIVPDEMEKRGF